MHGVACLCVCVCVCVTFFFVLLSCVKRGLSAALLVQGFGFGAFTSGRKPLQWAFGALVGEDA